MSEGPFTPVLATLGYVLSEDREKVLLLHRNQRPDDHHFGKYNGLGGKLHANENIVDGMCREIREESGLECEQLILRGTISWPGFGKNNEDWFGFLFIITQWHGELIPKCAEGELHWVKIAKLSELSLWEGDRHFLPMVFDQDPNAFHGVMPYKDGRPQSWHFSR